MFLQALVIIAIGTIVGFGMGILATRNKKMISLYALAGVAGALLYGCLPIILSSGFYLNMYHRNIAIAAALVTGLAILFSAPKK